MVTTAGPSRRFPGAKFSKHLVLLRCVVDNHAERFLSGFRRRDGDIQGAKKPKRFPIPGPRNRIISKINLRPDQILTKRPRHEQPGLLPARIPRRINPHQHTGTTRIHHPAIILEEQFLLPGGAIDQPDTGGVVFRVRELGRFEQTREHVAARVFARRGGVGVVEVGGVVDGVGELDLGRDGQILRAARRRG